MRFVSDMLGLKSCLSELQVEIQEIWSLKFEKVVMARDRDPGGRLAPEADWL